MQPSVELLKSYDKLRLIKYLCVLAFAQGFIFLLCFAFIDNDKFYTPYFWKAFAGFDLPFLIIWLIALRVKSYPVAICDQSASDKAFDNAYGSIAAWEPLRSALSVSQLGYISGRVQSGYLS